MQKRLLLSALVVSMAGCSTTAPKVVQVPAGQWVDEQIAQSATALSLAQLKLHQTSTAQPVAPLIGKTSGSSTSGKPTSSTLPAVAFQRPTAPLTVTTPVTALTAAVNQLPLGPTAIPHKAPESNTVVAAKAFPLTPHQPAVTVVAPIVPATKSTVPASMSPAQVVAGAPVVRPFLAPAPLPSWTAPVGSTLHQTVADWCKRAGVRLIWTPEDLDYPIDAPLNFKGSFPEAIAQLFPLYDGAKRSFVVDGNTSTQGILYVSERKK